MSALSAGLSLNELARELSKVGGRLVGPGGVRVTGVCQDSRHVEPGDLFVARSGAKENGANYVLDAERRGAVALLVDEGAALPALALPALRVEDVRLGMALAAEAVHGHPTSAVGVIGITGTNGKTTTAWLVASLLAAAGARPARLGTLGYAFEDDCVDESLTTPGADEIARFARRARERGASHLAMEVSSHALDQRRVDAVRFAAAAFTNLTQDHLDYHGTMSAYGRAKARLFEDLSPGVSVLFVDDPFGAELARRATGPLVRVGTARDNDLYPLSAIVDAGGIRGELATPAGPLAISSPLVGRHNLDNLLVALGVVHALGFDVHRAASALPAIAGAPGRLERCDSPGDDVTVLVDYAHTPDALGRALEAVRQLTRGAVHCVFGCGGDRDADKRPKMGQRVGTMADFAVITNDNPRSEDPTAIARAIESGLAPHGIAYEIVLDRAAAIDRAIGGAQPGDLVLIAGKGHEPYQIIGNDRRPFDDRVEARRALRARRTRSQDGGRRAS